MKQLLLVRHAKSADPSAAMNDFDRPLNDRGNRDAPMMAKRLVEKDITIDAILSSTAQRAISTAGYFAKAYNIKKNNIIGIDKLYHAPPPVFFDVIANLNNELDTVAIFAHNPGITDFVNQLTYTRIDNMPTCGIYAIKVAIKHWKDFEKSEKDFWFFDYPKL